MSILLTAAGIRVEAAATAAEATTFVLYDLPFEPDIALIDIVLRDRSATRLATVLRCHFPVHPKRSGAFTCARPRAAAAFER